MKEALTCIYQPSDDNDRKVNDLAESKIGLFDGNCKSVQHTSQSDNGEKTIKNVLAS